MMRGKIRVSTIVKSLMVLFLFLIILSYPQKSKAYAWYEGLISDTEFIAENSMSIEQIQNFLLANGSGLANYTIPENRVPGDNNPQPGAGQRPANFIYSVGHQFGVNPKVILVNLQKEESLITLSNPSSVRLEWAMGYGYYSGSPYTNPNDSRYKGGFGRQVYYASESMRYNYDRGRGPGNCLVGQYCQIQTRSWEAGTTNVYLSNRVSALLYRYTPYIYNGNYNFYNLYRQWFGAGAPNWSLLLIRSTDSPEVYLVDQGQKIYIPYVETLRNWGFSDSDIIDLDPSYVANYPTKSENLTMLVRGSNSANIYLIADGTKKYISSSASLNLVREMIAPYGISILNLSQELINTIPNGPDFVPLVKNSSNLYWVVYKSSRYPITTAMMPHWNISTGSAFQASDGVINQFRQELYLNQLVQAAHSQRVWYIDSGQKHWITSSAILNDYLKNNDLKIFPAEIINKVATGSNLTP